MVRRLRVLVACEFSGTVREAFAARGHDAWSCDLLESEKPGQHIRGDVLTLLDDGWDLLIAHPPCPRLANSGVRWLHERGLWKEMEAAAEFFLKLYNARIKKKALENPVPHSYARKIIGDYTQVIHPWQFGHGETKATCLWLVNLPKLKPSNIVKGRVHRLHSLPESKHRWKERSRTFQGIAEAMAKQWG